MMKDKVCVVTGGNAGIGFETALALAKQDAIVIILSRNAEKGTAAVEKIISQSGNSKVELVQTDLSSQDQIRSSARLILQKYQQVDRLINNAGTWFSKQQLTREGVEMQFAVNHLAYFLLTHELLPGLKKSADARVVNVSSDSHFHGKIHFDNLNLEGKYHGLKAYAQSKLANVLFVYHFHRINPFRNISIYAVQPGLVKTDIGLKHTFSLHALAWKIRRLGGVSPAEGAKTSVYLASSDEVKDMSGKYWEKNNPKSSSKNSYSREDQEKLWKMCEKFCGIRNYFETLA